MAIMDTQYSVLLFSFLCLIAIKLNVVECFSTGPPAAACTTLSPNPTPHGGPPQTTPVPYEVNISALADPNGGYSYEPGVTYMCKCMAYSCLAIIESVLLLPCSKCIWFQWQQYAISRSFSSRSLSC